MSAPVITSPLDYGLIGAVLILVYKLIDVLKAVMLKRHGICDDHAPHIGAEESRELFQYIKEIHSYTGKVGQLIDSGKLGCRWRDRDEVKDTVEFQKRVTEVHDKQTDMMEKLSDTMGVLIVEIKALSVELRLTRNGKSTR